MVKIGLFVALFGWGLAAQAQTEPNYIHSVVPPAALRVQGRDMNGIAKGEAQLPSGQTIYWTFIHSSQTHKLANIRFSLPDGISSEMLNQKLQTVCNEQFWAAIAHSLQHQQTEQQAANIIQKAISNGWKS